MPDLPIQDVRDIYGSQSNMILYGKSGIGKTYDVSRLPRVLVIDSERGLRSAPVGLKFIPKVSDAEEYFRLSPDEVPSMSIEVTSQAELVQVAELLNREEFQKRFRAVAVDTVTTLFERILVGIRDDYEKGLTEIIESVDKKRAMKNITPRGHGLAQVQAGDCLQILRDAPVHTIWVFHEGTIVTPDGDEIIAPLVGGKKFLPKLQTMVDFGFRMEIRGTKVEGGTTRNVRGYRTELSSSVWAKQRDTDDSLDEFEVNGLGTILEKLERPEPPAEPAAKKPRAAAQPPAPSEGPGLLDQTGTDG